jgi:hypothetical protein
VAERPGDMDERDVDARFASIVAAWDGPVPDATDPVDGPSETDAVPPPGAGPADRAGLPEDAEGTAGPTGEPDAVVPPKPALPGSPWVTPTPLDVVVPPSAWRAAETPDDATEAEAAAAEAALDDEHFEPPEVVLPPQEDLHFWGAVIGLVAGPLMLLYVVFVRPFHSTRWFIAAVVVSLLGFGLLVLRQPRHRDPTSGDDGARV